jgi:hypothetical protein
VTRLALLLATAALLVAAPLASAQAPAGTLMSDNVEFVKNFATSTDSSGARVKDGYFYITTERDLRIYDVKDPENPVQVGSLTFDSPGTPIFTEEDPDTNGKILLRWDAGLDVIDVSDKTAPKVIGSVDTDDQHTVTCVLDCTYAYGSEGKIVDLRDPTNPKVVGDWLEPLEASSNHDVTEVAPGLVLTSTEPMVLLDARTDPVHPTTLAVTQMPGFTHANLWPNAGTDRFALVGGEKSAPPACDDDASATFQTFDTTGWQTSRTFKLVGQFKMQTGTFTDGSSPYSTWCVHWFDEHPSFHEGGLVAIAWYEQGARFLQVGTDGSIKEIGYYLPFMGQTSGVYWITDRVLYTADYYRGMDVIKFTGDIPQGTPRPLGAPGSQPSGASTPSTAPRTVAGPSFDTLVTLPKGGKCVRKLRIKVRKAADPVTRLTVRVNGRKKLTARTKKALRKVVVKAPRRKRFTIQVEVRTRSGHRSAAQRTYKGC